MISDNTNIIVSQIENNKDGFHINEITPLFSNDSKSIKFLSFDSSIRWAEIKGSKNISVDQEPNGDILIDVSIIDSPQYQEIYYDKGKIGIGRLPLYNYTVDIKVPKNTITTALHIGDGVFGFSMGNATSSGFLPQIVGIGSDENDAGFYILGKARYDTDSRIPAIILDGRNLDNTSLNNRPILGISSGSYTDYKVIVESNGNVGIGKNPGIYKLKVDGLIRTPNIILGDDASVVDLLKELTILKNRLIKLEEK